jgi:hypothetical protein
MDTELETLTPAELTAHSRELLAAATPGPWRLIGGGEYITGCWIMIAPDDGGVSPENGALITEAPELIRLQADVIDAQAAELAARELMREHLVREAVNADSWITQLTTRLATANATIERLTTPPIVAHKGPHDTDRAMLLGAADKIERGYLAGGSNVSAAVAELLRRALAAAPTERPVLEQGI